MQKGRLLYILLYFAVVLSPLSAQAQCTNPSGVRGEVQFNTTYDVFQGCTARGWMAFHAPASPSVGGPAPFSFTDRAGVASGAVISSNAVTITGIGAAVAVSISGDGNPEFRIAGGAWVTNGSITDGQTLELRLTSGAATGILHRANVAVGTLSDQWDVTTGMASGPTGCPNIGDVCADGSIFAGDTNMHVADVHQSTAIEWSNETVNNTGARSNSDGAANQSWIVANRTLSQYLAFELCENLNRHGHTDWYLPARDELNVLYTNRSAIGGFISAWYWSSTESNSIDAWAQRFSDGYQVSDSKTYDPGVRCVRKDSGGGGSDITPNAFAFTDETDVAVSTQITSNSITIAGIDTAAPVSVSGQGSPQIRINSGAWVTSGNIENGQSLEVRLTSPANNSTTHSATIDIGGISDQWDVTTGAPTGPTGCAAIGDVCGDGSIFAGDTNMYVTDVNYTGFRWANMNEGNTGVRSDRDGAANQAWIVANRTLSQYPALQLCETLNRHGHTDWYLPARDELNVLYTNRSAIGGFMTNPYWSSTEINSNFAWRQDFSDGSQSGRNKASSFVVRCVRRD